MASKINMKREICSTAHRRVGQFPAAKGAPMRITTQREKERGGNREMEIAPS